VASGSGAGDRRGGGGCGAVAEGRRGARRVWWSGFAAEGCGGSKTAVEGMASGVAGQERHGGAARRAKKERRGTGRSFLPIYHFKEAASPIYPRKHCLRPFTIRNAGVL